MIQATAMPDFNLYHMLEWEILFLQMEGRFPGSATTSATAHPSRP